MTMPLEQTINTEPLLTIMGIVAAAWAIIPRTRLLQISLNLSWIDWALTGFALLLANYLTFEPLLSSFNMYYSIGPWLPGLDSASATYLIFVAWLAYAYLRSRFGHLPRSNTKKFKELINRLIATRQYDELALIIEPQLERLIHIEKNESLITPALIWLSNLARKVSKNLSSSIYPDNEPCTTAHKTIQNITNNHGLTTHLSLAHPNTCLKLIKVNSITPTDFSDRFIEALIENTGSQLYTELMNNIGLENPGEGKRLHIKEENTLIKELLSNPHLATKHYGTDRAIWRTAIYLIENDKTLVKKLNTPSNHHEDKDQNNCPISASLSMFNIMVHEGIHKGYQDHMNIWFLYRLTNSLLEQTRNGQNYNHLTKTPIYTLIERIIYITMDWIIEGAYVDNSLADKYRQSLVDSDKTIQNMRKAKVSEERIQSRIDYVSGINPDNLFISKRATELLNKITQTVIDSKAMSNTWKELCLTQIILQYKNIHGIASSSDKNTRDKERQLADLMLDQVVNGNYAPPEYRRQLLIRVKQLDMVDREPLLNRLLKAIEKDEEKERSH